jgi:hypothetical protein
MEKAHGWTYVRSKSNGRRRSGQQLDTSVSPAGPSLATPMTPYLASPVFGYDSSNAASNDNLASMEANANLFPVAEPSVDIPNDFQNAFNAEEAFDFNDVSAGFHGVTNGPFGHTPAMSDQDYRRESLTTSSDPMLSSNPSPAEGQAFMNAFAPNQPELNINTEFDDSAFMFSNATYQQPTPATSTGHSDMLNFNSFNPGNSTQPQHISPLSGQDLPLYSPADQMNLDEGFADDMTFVAPQAPFQAPHGDFELFPQAGPGTNQIEEMFPDLPTNNTTGTAYSSWDYATGPDFTQGFN